MFPFTYADCTELDTEAKEWGDTTCDLQILSYYIFGPVNRVWKSDQ